MESTTQELVPALAVLESVRCLECGEVYAKPAAGGTVHKNPGCPTCGYVGWIPLSLPGERHEQHRSGGDRLPIRALPPR
jgi:hypothetical protein